MDSSAVRKVIDQNLEGAYGFKDTVRVTTYKEKLIEHDKIALEKIIEKMKEIGGIFSVYTLWKTHKVGYSQNTIKRVLEKGWKDEIFDRIEVETKKGTIFKYKLIEVG